MAIRMPPWPEWQFEYIGTRFLGKLLGQWFALWVKLLKKTFRFFAKSNSFNPDVSENAHSSKVSLAKKLYKMTISTLFMIGILRLATLRAVWSRSGETWHQTLSAIVLLACASWVISLFWISFSK